MQKLAFFDLDGTLADTDAAFDRWAAMAGERHAAESRAARGLPTEDAAELGRGLTGALLEVAATAGARRMGSLEEFFAEVGRELGDPALGSDLNERFEAEFPATVTCYPGVLDGLRTLREAGWTIGVVTNGPTLRQRLKIVNTGVADHVDAWAISEEVGIAKPDRRIFEQAAQACAAGLDGGGWMVGDSLSADIAGGAAAGLRTAWIVGGEGGLDAARERLVKGAPAMPDLVLDTTVEAIGLILAE